MAVAWLPVAGYEGLYEISSSGDVLSFPRKGGNNRMYGGGTLNPVHSGPYLAVALSRDGKSETKRIHEIVAQAFLGERPEGQHVRHGPKGQQDNHAGNLCYGTVAENYADTIRDGTQPIGSRHGQSKLIEADIVDIRIRAANGESNQAIAEIYGVHRRTVWDAVNHRTWTHIA